MLKTIRNVGSIVESNETKDKVGDNSMVGNNEVINSKSFIKRKNQMKTG